MKYIWTIEGRLKVNNNGIGLYMHLCYDVCNWKELWFETISVQVQKQNKQTKTPKCRM